MKFKLKNEIFSIIIIMTAFILGFYFYGVFPEQVPVHWNFSGEVDRYGSRSEGAFVIPLTLFGMYLLFLAVPWLDPKKEKYQQFARVYNIFKNLLLLILLVVYLIASFNALGYDVRVEIWTPLIIGLLFLILGNYMGKIKPNWFMGIRTPWTLSNDEVWNKTHRLGGKLFMLFGLLMMLTPLMPYQSLTWSIIIPVVVVALIPTVYSFILYKRIKK